MVTKNNPGEFDCYENAAPDEPMFVLLGRDPTAWIVVQFWIFMRMLMGQLSTEPQLIEATACVQALRAWALKLGKEERVELAIEAFAQMCSKPEQPIDELKQMVLMQMRWRDSFYHLARLYFHEDKESIIALLRRQHRWFTRSSVYDAEAQRLGALLAEHAPLDGSEVLRNEQTKTKRGYIAYLERVVQQAKEALVNEFLPADLREDALAFPLERIVQHAVDHHGWHHEAERGERADEIRKRDEEIDRLRSVLEGREDGIFLAPDTDEHRMITELRKERDEQKDTIKSLDSEVQEMQRLADEAIFMLETNQRLLPEQARRIDQLRTMLRSAEAKRLLAKG